MDCRRGCLDHSSSPTPRARLHHHPTTTPPPPPPSTHAPTAQPPSLPRPDWAAGMRMEKATAAKAVGQDRPASTRAEEKQAKILVLPGPAQQGCVSRAEGFRYSSKCPMLLQSLPHPHPSVPA